MTEETTPRLTLRQGFGSSARWADIDLEDSVLRYRGLVERRERLAERSAFGLLALNGGSLVALFSVLSNTALTDLGIGKAEAGYCVAAFLVGAVLAVASIYFDSLNLTDRTAKEFQRLSHHRQTVGLLEMRLNTETMDRLGEQIEGLNKVPPRDFDYSPPALLSLHGAGGAWLSAIGVILWQVAFGLV